MCQPGNTWFGRLWHKPETRGLGVCHINRKHVVWACHVNRKHVSVTCTRVLMGHKCFLEAAQAVGTTQDTFATRIKAPGADPGVGQGATPVDPPGFSTDYTRDAHCGRSITLFSGVWILDPQTWISPSHGFARPLDPPLTHSTAATYA